MFSKKMLYHGHVMAAFFLALTLLGPRSMGDAKVVVSREQVRAV
jgi:hypothetical protein